MTQNSFKESVYEIVADIPKGRVMYYGQIAALCGQPRASRIVGQLAHYGPSDLPWHRVVMKSGSMAGGFPGGMEHQKALLVSEGISISENFVINDMTGCIYDIH